MTHTYIFNFSLLSVSVRVDYGVSVTERRPDEMAKKSQKTFGATLCLCICVCACLCVSHVLVKIISHYTNFNWPLMIRPSLCARLKR